MIRQRGLSLIELLVALALSLVLMAGVIELFIANKKSYQLSEAMAHMQDNARFAAQKLTYEIRMAGYTGCTSRDTQNTLVNNTIAGGYSVQFRPQQGLQGWEAANSAYGQYNSTIGGTGKGANNTTPVDITTTNNWSSVDANGNPIYSNSSSSGLAAGTYSVPGSDMLQLWGITGQDVVVTNMSPGKANTVITTTTNANFQQGQILMMTNCQVADVFQACNVQSTSGGSGTTAGINVDTSAGSSGAHCDPGNNVTQALLNGAGAHVVALRKWLYYVGKRANNPDNPPALYRRITGVDATPQAPEELVEGVESLQILYGEDTDGNGVADRYVPANKVKSWLDVISVRIGLLMQSRRTDLVDGAQTIKFNGTTVTSSDGRLRFPFIFNVTLRNRVQ